MYIPIPKLTEKQLKNFWKKIDKKGPTECWPWTGAKTDTTLGGNHGVVRLKVAYKHHPAFKAHRVAYFLATGEDPGELKVLHSCDNPPCCNPNHLYRGTQQDNITDCKIRGRLIPPPPGSQLGCTHKDRRLTDEQIQEIYRLAWSGLVCTTTIAEQFGITQSLVSQIKVGRIWRDITGAPPHL